MQRQSKLVKISKFFEK